MNKYNNDEEWCKIIREWRNSGMSQKDWCHMNNIPKSTFDHAINRLKNKGKIIPQNKTKKNVLNQSPEVIITKGDITVKIIGAESDPSLLTNIIKAMGGSESSVEEISNASNNQGPFA